jgi:hypothetical protein
MYQIDILKGIEWVEFCQHEDIKVIDKAVYKLTLLRPNKHMRILKDDILLCWLNGSEEQYWFWKNKYVREKGINFDYVASFYEHQKKKIK